MQPPPSKILEQLPASQDAVRPQIFRAYGDADDPLRLTVLLAEHLRASLPAGSDDVAVCLDPKARSSDRIDALRDLLVGARKRPETWAALVDPDALAPDDDMSWEDLDRARMRRSFFETILSSVERGGWILVRTSPSASLTRSLEQSAMEEPSPSMAPGSQMLAAFAPECRPAVRWLLAHKHLRPKDAEQIVATVQGFDDHVLALTYDALPPSARKAARLIGAARAPMRKNGSFGRFAWSTTPSPEGFPRADVDALLASGLLIADEPARPEMLRVPRRARRLLETYAVGDEAAAREVHAHLVFDDFDQRSLDEQLEAHFHAVRSLDVKRAMKTAQYYGVELSTLATELSREKREYAKAAEVFGFVRDTFDSTDAYVWEYWAYNLALWDREDDASGRHEADILKGYGKADELAKRRNPLYRGRLLGYRAERGANVAGEFAKGMTQYLRDYGEDGAAISRFAEPVLDGTKRRGDTAALAAMFSAWRTCLERLAPRVVAKFSE